MNPQEVGQGGFPSPVDYRDWTLASVGASAVYPSSCFIDVSSLKARMQGKIGSCVGNTFEEIIYFITGSTEDLSWRFVYALCKCLEGTAGYEQFRPCQEGTYPALAAQVIRKFGVPKASLCVNDINLPHEDFVFQRKIQNIPKAAFDDAGTRKSASDFVVPEYPRAVTISDIKQAITYAKANYGAVAILRDIGDTYWMANGVSTWDKNKLLPIKTPAQSTGGHEELLYGYEDEVGTGRTKIFWLNHWSKEWCDNGRGWEYADVWLSRIREMRVVLPIKPSVPVDNFKYTFKVPMQKGDKGADVVALQHCLALEKLWPAQTPWTGFYGDTTFSEVCAFQLKYASEILTPLGLTAPTGRVGAMTLRKLNSLYS